MNFKIAPLIILLLISLAHAGEEMKTSRTPSSEEVTVDHKDMDCTEEPALELVRSTISKALKNSLGSKNTIKSSFEEFKSENSGKGFSSSEDTPESWGILAYGTTGLTTKTGEEKRQTVETCKLLVTIGVGYHSGAYGSQHFVSFPLKISITRTSKTDLSNESNPNRTTGKWSVVPKSLVTFEL